MRGNQCSRSKDHAQHSFHFITTQSLTATTRTQHTSQGSCMLRRKINWIGDIEDIEFTIYSLHHFNLPLKCGST